MKNKKIRILSVTMGLVVFFFVCGTQMHEITDEERHIIAEAAASFVAKYNTYQKDGMNQIGISIQKQTWQFGKHTLQT